jgi:hypothetical protein
MKLNDLYIKAVSAKSADKFLTKYADVLNQIAVIQPILQSNNLPTPKVSAICQMLWAEVEKEQAKKKSIAEQETCKEKEPKEAKVRELPNYTCTIIVQGNRGDEVVGVDAKGKELVRGFPNMQSAETWAENQMWDRADTLYAEVVANKLIGKNGPMVFKHMRSTAMFNKLKDKRGPECKKTATSSSLSFRPKCTNDKVYFSKG